MPDMNDFKELSYFLHESHIGEYAEGARKEKHGKTWLDENTVDKWRHNRMYSSIDPFLRSFPQASWLTVGDGRYGSDAHYIQLKGGNSVASDISDTLLVEAKRAGYIAEYSKENAEALSFSDNSFDFVLCKESFHHFPRPGIALYEMIRVARRAVILIEPNDKYITECIRILLSRRINDAARRLLKRNIARHPHEECGNYLFSISEREIEKVALGINMNIVAFRYMNDCYIEGVEYEKLCLEGALFKKVKRSIMIRNLLCKIRIVQYGIVTSIIFKGAPDHFLREALRKSKYIVRELPENPYVV